MAFEIGPIGIWCRYPPWERSPEAAAELEDLGFAALWLGFSPGGDLRVPEALLGATRSLIVGTSIVNVWQHAAAVVAESHHRVTTAHPGRFVLGLGIGHRANVGEAYRQPLRKLAGYLDELDAATPPVPVEGRAIAALGPRALALTRERSLGSLPYLTTPGHTRAAREALGPDALLAPEQKVVLASDPAAARALARDTTGFYLALPNYVNNLRRLGFGDSDFENNGSDRLVDALVAWGDAVPSRIQEHLDAGADHVAVQVLTADGDRVPLDEYRALAEIVRDVVRV